MLQHVVVDPCLGEELGEELGAGVVDCEMDWMRKWNTQKDLSRMRKWNT